MAVEIIPLSSGGGTDTVVGGVTFPGAIQASESGGQQAPSRKVASGYTWTTRVGPEPIEITLTGWANQPTYEALTALRDEQSPISVSVGDAELSAAVVTNATSDIDGERPGAHKVTVDIKQVQQGSIQTSAIAATPITGPMGTDPFGGNDNPFAPGGNSDNPFAAPGGE